MPPTRFSLFASKARVEVNPLHQQLHRRPDLGRRCRLPPHPERGRQQQRGELFRISRARRRQFLDHALCGGRIGLPQLRRRVAKQLETA